MIKSEVDNENDEAEQQNENELTPEDIIKDLGGCGRYQIRMSVAVHLIKTIVCFSSYNLVLFSATPTWYCSNNANNTCFNGTETCDAEKKACYIGNGTECTAYVFDPDFDSYVGEFNLVCKRDFIPNTINSINIAGNLVGNLIGGQLADLIGRKIALFASFLTLLVCHLLAYFSTNWQMLTVAFFFAGVGCGVFLTVQFTLLSEYSLSRWRVWVIGFPSWPMQSSLFALFAWIINDWRYLQLLTALSVLPALATWFILPESFRWYIAHNNRKKAVRIVRTVAKYNKRKDVEGIGERVLSMRNPGEDHRFTFIHLFKTKRLVRMTLLLMFLWASIDTISYGISFGLQTLSGNIFLNLFWFSLAGIPSKAIAIYLQNRFGRRVATILSFSAVALPCFTAGAVQRTGADYKDVITNVCVFIANAGIAMAWGPFQTITVEIYPTVIRSISFGFLNVVGKVSAVVGPQLVYLDSFVPGILVLVCGSMATLSIIIILLLPETMDKNLEDTIGSKTECNEINAEYLRSQGSDSECSNNLYTHGV